LFNFSTAKQAKSFAAGLLWSTLWTAHSHPLPSFLKNIRREIIVKVSAVVDILSAL